MYVCEICNWKSEQTKYICEKCGFFLHSHSKNDFYKEFNGIKVQFLTRYAFLNKIIYNKYNYIHIKGKNHIKPKYHEL